MKIANREVPTNEVALMGAAVVLFVDSFLHWFGGKLCVTVLGNKMCGNVDAGISAWNSGFFAWASVLLGIAAAGLVAVRRFTSTQVQLPAGPNFVVLGLAALGLLFALIKLAIGETAHSFGGSASIGRDYGLYIGLIVLIVETGVAFTMFKASGESAPWENRG